MIKSRAFWIGLLGSAAFLGIMAVFLVDDFDKLRDAFADANFAYAAPSLAFYTLALWFRTVRWRFLLDPVTGGTTKRGLFPVVVVGYMANNLIPMRIGELMRAYYLTLREGVSTMATFGTVALERASDVIALLLLVAIAAIFGAIGLQSTVGTIAQDVPGGVPVLVLAALLPFIGVFAIVAYVVIVSPEKVRRLTAGMLFFVPVRLRVQIVGIAMNLISGLTVVRTWRGLVRVILLSLPVWIAEIVMYYLIALGFDIRSVFGSQLEFIAAIVAFGAAANLAGVMPSTSGSLGAFDFFGAAALTALGVSGEIALAYALTVHIVLWGPVTVAGALILLADKTSMGNLARGARSVRRRIASSDVDANGGEQQHAESNP